MDSPDDIGVILKDRLRNELGGTVTNILNKLMKSQDDHCGQFQLKEDELVKRAVLEVTQTERYWKTSNNILLDSRRLRLEPTPVRSSYSYLPNDQIEELGELLYHPDLELRLKSLDYLLRCVSNETLLQLPGWKRLENGLGLNSLHRVSVLSEVSLQVYNKFLNSTDARLVGEIYRSLLKTLSVRSTWNTEDKLEDSPTLRIAGVLVNFLQKLPRKWVRFPEVVIDGIISNTVYALDSCKWGNYGNQGEFGLATCFGYVDRHSDWLKNLLLSAPVRLKLLKYLKSTSFVKSVVEVISSNHDRVHVYDLLASISVICRLLECKGGYEVITITEDVTESWGIWSQVIKISRNLQFEINIESILEKNPQFCFEIIAPFLTDSCEDLRILNRALRTSTGLLAATRHPELRKLIAGNLIREVDPKSIDIYCQLIANLPPNLIKELDIKSISITFGISDHREISNLYRVLGKLSRITQYHSEEEGLITFIKLIALNLNEQLSYLDYLESNLVLNSCQHCRVNLVKDMVSLGRVLECLKETCTILLKCVWQRVNCFCDDNLPENELGFLENVYAYLAPYYPEILAGNDRPLNFYELSLLVNVNFDCQECFKIISLTVYRIIFKSIINIVYFESHFDIRSKILDNINTQLGVDQISILFNCVLVESCVLGGPTEKIHFPDDLNELITIKSNEGVYPLMDNLDYPLNYVIQTPDSTKFDKDFQLNLNNLIVEFKNFILNENLSVSNVRIFWEYFLLIENNINKEELPINENNINEEELLINENNINEEELLINENNINEVELPINENNVNEEELPINENNVNEVELPVNENNVNEVELPINADNINEVEVPINEDNINEVEVPINEDNINEVEVPINEDNINEVEVPINEDNINEVDLPINEKKYNYLIEIFLNYCSSHKWLNSEVEIIQTILPATNRCVFLTSYLISNADIRKTLAIYSRFNSLNFDQLLIDIDNIVQNEIPKFYTALAMSDVTPRQIASFWTGQCFWNILDMADILAIMLMSVLISEKQLKYWCVAIMKHYESPMTALGPKMDLTPFLINYNAKFDMKTYFNFVEELTQRYD